MRLLVALIPECLVPLLLRFRLGRVLLEYRLAGDLEVKPLPFWLIWTITARRD